MSSCTNYFPTACLLCLGLAFSAPAQQQIQAPLDNQRIMQLAQAGVHSDELQRIIASAPTVNFLMDPASTDVMLKAGVPEDVIKAMAARESEAGQTSNSVSANPVRSDPMRARKEPGKTKQPQQQPVRVQTYALAVAPVYAALERVAIRDFSMVNASELAGVVVFKGRLSSGFCSAIAFEGTATVDATPDGGSRVQLKVRQLWSDGCMIASLKDGAMREKFANIFWSDLAQTVQQQNRQE